MVPRAYQKKLTDYVPGFKTIEAETSKKIKNNIWGLAKIYWFLLK